MSIEEKLSADCIVIGGGVIGLAVAARLAPSRSVILLEKNPQFGQETSSRNSEVIHSGIYYPKASKKTEWCIRGRELLYDYCKKHRLPYSQCGKLVIATDTEEERYLEKLTEHCKDLQVEHSILGQNQIQNLEALVVAKTAVYLPMTGIVDSHALMSRLEQSFVEQSGILAYQHKVRSIEREQNNWLLTVDSGTQVLTVESPVIVNCAGLGAALLTNEAFQTKRYEHRYCRGRYFSLASKYDGRFRHLVYPVPQKDGLGVHVTLDLNASARLGPDVDWCPDFTYENCDRLYDCDWDSLRIPFLSAVNKYCPTVSDSDVTPGLIGIRPKLFVDGVAHPDFLVENLQGFIHCLGIESPGLTSALAIADAVFGMV